MQKSAIDEGGGRGRGKLHSLIRAAGRFDIVIWWGNNTPRAIIEVKNGVTRTDQIKGDILRISKLLSRNPIDSTFQFGLIAYHSSTNDSKEFSAKERLSNRIDNIYRDSINVAGRKISITPYQKSIRIEKKSAWTAAALLLRCKC